MSWRSGCWPTRAPRLEEVQFADRVTLPFVMLAGGETQLLPKLQELCRGSADIMFSKPYFAPF